MADRSIEFQATVYMYDLTNSANEHGFKSTEGWQLSLATSAEKLDIEKEYLPTISARVIPELLSDLFRLVRSKLIPRNRYIEQESNWNDDGNSEKMYLIAFNPQRHR